MDFFKKIRAYHKEEGFGKTLKKIFRGIFYRLRIFLMSLVLKLKRKKIFYFKNQPHFYLHHVYNNAWRSERSVEVPIIFHLVQRAVGRNVLEVGNVLRNYYKGLTHDVLDKYERGEGIINEDVADFRPTRLYDLIVSISTMEHVGWDETPKDPEKIRKSLARLREYLTPGGQIIVTMPLGYNRNLDNDLREGRLRFDEQSFLKRVSAENDWREASHEEVKDAIYGHPFLFANAIIVGRLYKNKKA